MSTPPSVLLIDDDDFVRTTVSAQLRTLGIVELETAPEATTALRVIGAGRRFDLIIADLMMPGMDGVEMLRELNVRNPAAALVLISSAEQSVLRAVAILSRQRGLRVLGAIRKPVRAEILGELIEVLMTELPAPTQPRPRLSADGLAQALDRGKVHLRASPCVRLGEETIYGVDLRAHLYEDGSEHEHDHDQLLATALQHGLTSRLTASLVTLGIDIAAELWRQHISISVSVSLPGIALNRLDLPDQLEHRLRQAGVLQNLFGIGIPEQALSDDCSALDVLARLRMREMRVCIDDFSGNHCGFTRLQRIPASEVRLDRRLLGAHRVGTRLLEHAVQTARTLELPCIADGVATRAQAEAVERLDCVAIQGPLVGTAIAVDDLPDWIAARTGAATPVRQAAAHSSSAHARLN
ncbi:EAL domain-containing protein [Sinimarinibacterium sp. CAU 1509]|uniref:EAL domain-containing protein n=1 Tax=Sinimarinibacterium sp. CAU 1509 TaxID=2562283 RepID=UPI0010AC76B6|nr:EAL domain-containing protein [Sinimarinibacterium sp. CAU 1509]TJY58354.1 EAL domain-containing protein [Sinimarinibacterium sp. CAU 1509]